jgi:tRNA C32,U32 (ribose-2'-O)-methylase TrmJ
MREPNLQAIQDQISRLMGDIEEVRQEIPTWNAHNTEAGRRLRSIAGRVVLSAKTLESLVKENTYTP